MVPGHPGVARQRSPSAPCVTRVQPGRARIQQSTSAAASSPMLTGLYHTSAASEPVHVVLTERIDRTVAVVGAGTGEQTDVSEHRAGTGGRVEDSSLGVREVSRIPRFATDGS